MKPNPPAACVCLKERSRSAPVLGRSPECFRGSTTKCHRFSEASRSTTLLRPGTGALRSARFFGLLLVVVLAVSSGCKTASLSDPVTGSGYQPKNYYRSLGQLPVNIRRVAVLPTTCDDNISDVQHGRDSLESVITEELAKTKKFEVIVVTPDQLRVWTGRTSWRAEEPLPADFLKVLKRALECDAVLFGRVSQYRAYPPLTVGLSFKLADVHSGDFIWAVDEVFDSSEPSVVNSARRYQLMREQLPASLADSRSILTSPGTFGRYAANSVFQTLPAR